jgi:hypothetical protein
MNHDKTWDKNITSRKCWNGSLDLDTESMKHKYREQNRFSWSNRSYKVRRFFVQWQFSMFVITVTNHPMQSYIYRDIYSDCALCNISNWNVYRLIAMQFRYNTTESQGIWCLLYVHDVVLVGWSRGKIQWMIVERLCHPDALY